MSSGGGSRTVVQKSGTKLDPEVRTFRGRLLDRADTEMQRGYTGYGPERFAAQSIDTQRAMQAVRDLQGRADAGYQQAQGVAGQVGAYDPRQVGAQSFLQGPSVAQYMSPHDRAVIGGMQKQAMDNMARQSAAISANAEMAGAGTGDRAAIERGTMRAQHLSNLDAQTAALLNQSYGQAAQMKQADLQRNLAQQRLNQAAGLQGQALNLQGARALGDLTGAGQMAGYRDTQALARTGAAEEGYAQRQKDWDYQQWLDAQNWDKNQMSWGANLLAGSPSGQSSTTETPMYRNRNHLGGAMTGAATGAMMTPATPWVGGAIGGGIGLLGSFMG